MIDRLMIVKGEALLIALITGVLRYTKKKHVNEFTNNKNYYYCLETSDDGLENQNISSNNNQCSISLKNRNRVDYVAISQ